MRCANFSATEGNLSVLYGEYLHVAKTRKMRQWTEPVCTQARKVSLPDARCIFMSKDVQTPLYFLPDSYRLSNWVWWQGVFIIVMRPLESGPSKWVTNHLVNQMYILQNKYTAMPGASQYFDWMPVLCKLPKPPISSSIFIQHTLPNFVFIFLPAAYIEGPWVPLFLPWLGLWDVLFPCYWCWQKQGTFFFHVLLISQTECTRCFLVAKDTWRHNHT